MLLLGTPRMTLYVYGASPTGTGSATSATLSNRLTHGGKVGVQLKNVNSMAEPWLKTDTEGNEAD